MNYTDRICNPSQFSELSLVLQHWHVAMMKHDLTQATQTRDLDKSELSPSAKNSEKEKPKFVKVAQIFFQIIRHLEDWDV